MQTGRLMLSLRQLCGCSKMLAQASLLILMPLRISKACPLASTKSCYLPSCAVASLFCRFLPNAIPSGNQTKACAGRMASATQFYFPTISSDHNGAHRPGTKHPSGTHHGCAFRSGIDIQPAAEGDRRGHNNACTGYITSQSAATSPFAPAGRQQ